MHTENKTKKQSGGCLCGQVRYEIEGGFDLFVFCHCSYCQKDTGSAHAANLISHSAKLKWISGEEETKIYNLTGTRHTRCFCQTCGSALPYMYAGKMLILPAGSIEFDPPIAPTAHVFYQSRAPWEDSLAGIQKFDQFPEIPGA